MKTVNNNSAKGLLRQHPVLKQLTQLKQPQSPVARLINRLNPSNVDVLAYHRLELARHHYAKEWPQLSHAEQQHIEQIAMRQIQIENAVLASTEAHTVMVRHDTILQAYHRIMGQYQTQSGGLDTVGFKQDLQRTQLDESLLAIAIVRQLSVEQVMQSIAEQISAVSEAEARQYYQDNLSKFIFPEQRHVSHILITINDALPDNHFDTALARATQIAAYLAQHPEQFTLQAQQYSECPTALEGGQLGKVKKGSLYPELDQALFAMSAGQISQPVQSEIGFHILWCQAIDAEKTLSFEEIAQDLVTQLTTKARKLKQKIWLRKLISLMALSASDCTVQ
jgi:peptidyl-prolyl cis-trans isomerase C